MHEIAPPWVQTDWIGGKNDPRAMPLAEFIDETMQILETDADEVLVKWVKELRNNVGPSAAAFVDGFNDRLANSL
jgi:uncharacterized oxidoreductase